MSEHKTSVTQLYMTQTPRRLFLFRSRVRHYAYCHVCVWLGPIRFFNFKAHSDAVNHRVEMAYDEIDKERNNNADD